MKDMRDYLNLMLTNVIHSMNPSPIIIHKNCENLPMNEQFPESMIYL